MHSTKSRVLPVVLIFSLACNVAAVMYGIHKIGWKLRQHADVKRTVVQPVYPDLTGYFMWRDRIFRVFPQDSNSIIFLGNSLTQLFELSELFGNARIKNRGIMGDNSRGVLRRLDEVTKRKPRKIFIEIGINDLLKGYPIDTVKENYREIVGRIQKESPGTHIFIQSLLPSNSPVAKSPSTLPGDIRMFNRFLDSLAEAYHASYIDLYSSFVKNDRLDPRYDGGDRLHLNGEGYLLWRDLIRTYVNE